MKDSPCCLHRQKSGQPNLDAVNKLTDLTAHLEVGIFRVEAQVSVHTFASFSGEWRQPTIVLIRKSGNL